MNTLQTATARQSLQAAYDGTRPFPDIVRELASAGFEGYTVDYRCGTTTYFLPDGDHVTLNNPPSDQAVSPAFDQPAIAARIQWAQANPPGYSYKAFCHHVKAAGCAGYIVSFSGRRVLYFGRTAETHVELFPQ
ncbi:MAG TPA: hypothetical protein VNQ90_21480 [Chthoniobacteraceae bacterium]|nr:hypothetical protein [Chthoniobacteraceae bacterium]